MPVIFSAKFQVHHLFFFFTVAAVYYVAHAELRHFQLVQ